MNENFEPITDVFSNIIEKHTLLKNKFLGEITQRS